MNPIKTREQFENMIQDVLDEIDDLKAAIEYDEEFIGDAMNLVGPLEKDIHDLREQVKSGNYEFGCNEDLPFVGRLKTADARLLPFGQLLVWINRVHRDGLP